MRLPQLFLQFLLLFSVLTQVALSVSWSPDDIEVFNVRQKLQKLEGTDINFYEYVGVKRGISATTEEIASAYRRKSLAWHPDKRRKGTSRKEAQDRFTLLGLVGDVLRSPHRRERYDFFLKNGFPEWTGKDYLYSRFRPGLISTLVFLFLFVSGMQYVFHALTASRQRAFIKRYIDEVKQTAWRPSGGLPPLSGARKYVSLGADNDEGDRRVRKFAVDFDGSVYLVDEKTGEESLLDTRDVEEASWKRTLVYTFPLYVWNLVMSRVKAAPKIVQKPEEDGHRLGSGEESGKKENGKGQGAGGHAKIEKVGGQRRVKKRN